MGKAGGALSRAVHAGFGRCRAIQQAGTGNAQLRALSRCLAGGRGTEGGPGQLPRRAAARSLTLGGPSARALVAKALAMQVCHQPVMPAS
ncbi:hypothetical protein EMIT0373P_20742 [Pseudomonas chlororaphis]